VLTLLSQVKEEKFSGDTIVTGVNRKHDKLEQHVPFKTRAAPGAAAGGPGPAGGAAGAGAPADGELVIEEVYKPSRELRPVFQKVQADHEALYTGGGLGRGPAGCIAIQNLRPDSPDSPDSPAALLLLLCAWRLSASAFQQGTCTITEPS
jgi:translation initiation factor 2D